MILHWVRTFDKVDEDTMQETFFEPQQNLTMAGAKIKYCRVCHRWKTAADYRDTCCFGYHEDGAEVKLESAIMNKGVVEATVRVGDSRLQ